MYQQQNPPAPRRFLRPETLASFAPRPRVGPDIAPDDTAFQRQMAMPPPPQPQGGFDFSPLAALAEQYLGRPGSAPMRKATVESGTGGKFLGPMAFGGILRRPGDTAVVGEEGPELAVKDKAGTAIIPLNEPQQPAPPTPRFVPPELLAALAPPAMQQEQVNPAQQQATRPRVAAQPNPLAPPLRLGGPDQMVTTVATELAAPRPQLPMLDALAPDVQSPMTARALQSFQTPARDVGAAAPPQTRPRLVPPELLAPRPAAADALAPPETRARFVPPDLLKPQQPAGDAQQQQASPRAAAFVSQTARELLQKDDPLAHLAQQIEYEQTHPAQNANGRWKGALLSALYSFLMGASKTGNLAGALSGAATGFGVGVFKQDFDEQLGQQYRVADMQQRYEGMAANRKTQGDLADQASQRRLRDAQATYYEARPDIEAGKRADAAAQREHQAVLAHLRILKGTKLDPNNARHAALLERAANAGVEVDPDSWNDTASNLVPVDLVDPANPTQKRRQYFNKATGQLTDVGQSGYVAPIHVGTEMTSAQEDASKDRKRGLGERERHDAVTEGQGGERIEISRDNAAHRGRPTTINQNARLGKAATLARLLEEEKDKAAHPPYTLPGRDGSSRTLSEAERQAYTARHKQAAARYRDEIKSAYDDLFETGEDADGWAYAKPKQAPLTAAPRGGAVGGYTEEQVRQRARDQHKDEEEAVRAARKAHLIP